MRGKNPWEFRPKPVGISALTSGNLEEQHNALCTSPRTCFRSAFRHGVIDNDPFWIDLTVLRNYTVHTYNEQLADYVYSRLTEAARRFRAVLAATGDLT